VLKLREEGEGGRGVVCGQRAAEALSGQNWRRGEN
jgi:hypothetical protein